jgi:hypothetical protein
MFNDLSFVEAVDGFGQCIVIRVTNAANRGPYFCLLKTLRILDRQVLDPSVAMMDEAVTAGVSGMSRTMLKFGRVALLD